MAACCVAVPAHAEQDAVRSCYLISKIDTKPPAARSVLYVVIDQTTELDQRLKNLALENVHRLLRPGTRFGVARFSAFTQGFYTEMVTAGALDQGIQDDVRADISKPKLRQFDSCMSYQGPFAWKQVEQAMDSSWSTASNEIGKSDILSSLKEVSAAVRKAEAPQKTVLIISDMLENSSISSFYSKQRVRSINPEDELKLAASSGLFGDFGGARIYVIGAGLLSGSSETSRSAYRDPKTMKALQTFWAEYFSKSNARLVEFGQPSLLSPIE